MAEIAVVLIAMLLRWREDMLRIEAEVMQHETCSDGDEECKDQKSDKSFIHVFFPACRFRFLYDTSGGGLVYDLAGENGLDLEALRGRLQRLRDRELVWFGRAARYMCSPAANLGKEPRQAFVTQLREAAKEWGRRRHTGA
jgi:hypothetical protein